MIRSVDTQQQEHKQLEEKKRRQQAYVEFTQNKIDNFYLNSALLLRMLAQPSRDFIIIIIIEGALSFNTGVQKCLFACQLRMWISMSGKEWHEALFWEASQAKKKENHEPRNKPLKSGKKERCLHVNRCVTCLLTAITILLSALTWYFSENLPVALWCVDVNYKMIHWPIFRFIAWNYEQTSGIITENSWRQLFTFRSQWR